MAYFILTDSDWPWDSDEAPPLVVEADDEQEAARLAAEKLLAQGDDFDGIQFQIARLATSAFVGVERDGNRLVLDPTIYVSRDAGSATVHEDENSAGGGSGG